MERTRRWHPLDQGELPDRWPRGKHGHVKVPFAYGPERMEYLASFAAVRAGEPGSEARLVQSKVALMSLFIPQKTTREERVAGMRADLGWGLSVGVIALAYKATEDEFEAAFGAPMLDEALMPVPSEAERLRALPYEAYLRTPHWRRVRSAALAWAEGRCQVCNIGRELEVHHRTYERRGEERQADLTVLCARCHSHFHGTERAVA